MKRTALYILVGVVLAAVLAITIQVLTRPTNPRRIRLDDDWYFIEGSHAEAIDAHFDPDSAGWQHIDLPHDFAALPRDRQTADVADSLQLIGPFAQSSPGKAATGWTLGGEGWYVHKLRARNVDYSIDSHKRVELYFEGAYNQAYVWVNGHEACSNMYGYNSFRCDITDLLLRDENGILDLTHDNLITVRVVNEGKNSRWYAGAGIYRHVWLQVTDPLQLDAWRTFVRTTHLHDINGDRTIAQEAVIAIDTDVQCLFDSLSNDHGNIRWEMLLLTPDGQQIVAKQSGDVASTLPLTHIYAELRVPNARLWNCDHPVLYQLQIKAQHFDSKDQLTLPIGIRTLQFSAERGFLLNGQPTLLRGACVHHDNGLLGARAYDRAEQRKISLLRQAGFNAIRGSHNPMSETLMAECDRQGMLVIDEAFDMWHKRKNKQDYHQYFDSLSTHDLKNLVRRDRNHPSVIMYSIGNEIPERADSLGMVIASRLRANILDLDETRPVTAGINSIWNSDRTARLSIAPACHSLDVAGYNYRVWNYEPEHREDPKRVMYGSETVLGELASDWQRVVDCPWVIGDFVWTGMDYIGEAGISNCLTKDAQENVHFFMPWPWYNAWCGNLDLIGQVKPQHYYQQVVYGDIPLAINVEPSRYYNQHDPADSSTLVRSNGERPSISYWGWMDEQHQWYQPGCEGDSVRVNVYSRDSIVSLLLNDRLVANVKVCDTTHMGHAMVCYEPGTLRAISAHCDGNSQASRLVTPDVSTLQLRLTPDRSDLTADGQDLSYVLIELVDAQGRLIPETGRQVSLFPSPSQQLAGSGNAQPDDMQSFGSLTPTLFRGQAMAIVRATKTPSKMLLKVTSAGLKEQSVTINCL